MTTTTPTAKIDPRIGELCRKGKTVYYAYAPDYVESESREAVAQKLVDMDLGR